MTSIQQLVSKQTRDMELILPEQVQALHWTKEKLQAMRQTRLRQLLAYAKDNSRWYRHSLDKIDIENFTEERLTELPVLTKSLLMENWDDIVTRPELSLAKVEKHIEQMQDDPELLYFLEHYHIIATGGSSGKRGVFIYDWNEWNVYYAMFRRFRLYNPQQRPIGLDPTKKINIALVAASGPIHGTYALAKTFKIRNSETFHFHMTLPVSEIVAGLNRVQPDVIQSIPSTLYILCQEVAQGRLQFQPKIISSFGEAFYPEVREVIEKTWPNAAIFNNYGTSEGLAGIMCTAGRKEMHLNDDLCIVEPVDAQGRRVPRGTLSEKFYLTNLFHYTVPLIRYEMTDRLTFLDKDCDCGIHYQLIAEPQSRFEFDFMYEGDILVHHVIFLAPLLQDKNIQEYQVIQTPQGVDIKIRTTGRAHIEKLTAMFCERLKNLGLKSPVVNFIEVDAFEYPISGKLKRFVALARS